MKAWPHNRKKPNSGTTMPVDASGQPQTSSGTKGPRKMKGENDV